jgi:hypothetical protein
MPWFSVEKMIRVISGCLILALAGMCFSVVDETLRCEDFRKYPLGSDVFFTFVDTSMDYISADPKLSAKTGGFSSVRIAFLRIILHFGVYLIGNILVLFSLGKNLGISHITIKDTIMVKLRI